MLALRQQLAMVANRNNKRFRLRRPGVLSLVIMYPTAEWTSQQIVEVFPFNSAPRYLLHDRDSIFGKRFRTRVKSLGIGEVVTAPRSPWQNPYVERIIGSIRREGLNHVIIYNEWHLRRVLKIYATYYRNIGRLSRAIFLVR